MKNLSVATNTSQVKVERKFIFIRFITSSMVEHLMDFKTTSFFFLKKIYLIEGKRETERE